MTRAISVGFGVFCMMTSGTIGYAAQAKPAARSAASGGSAAATVGAVGMAAAAVGWAYTDIQRALSGQRTLTDEAVETWGHYGFVGTFREFGRELRDLF